MTYPDITYLKDLVHLLTSSNIDSIKVGEIEIVKTRAAVVKSTKEVPQDRDPTDDEIMSWSLETPLPAAAQLLSSLQSEPKRKKQVRKEVV